MSAIKASQVHDGFATIRSRGLQRSRSRVEQLERLKPMAMKCDSMPLYENPNEIINVNNNNNSNNNNNNINSKNANILNGSAIANDHQVVYQFESFSGLTETSPTTEALQNEAKMLKTVDEIELSVAKNISCGTFKCSSNGQLSTSDHGGSSSIDMNDRSSLPPPSPCYETYSNGYHSPKTPPELPPHCRNSSAHHSDYFLYSRPTSPLYEQSYASLGLSANGTTASSSPEAISANEIMYSSLPPSSKLFTTSYYTRNDSVAGEYALQKLGPTKKPTLNFKTQSLQYRKSYSHPTHTIYENTTSTTGGGTTAAANSAKINKYDHGIRNYYNSTTNYYDPSEMSYISSYGIRQPTTTTATTARNSEILFPKEIIESSTLPKPIDATAAMAARNNFTRRPYATLAHPRDAQKRLQRCQSHFDDQRKYGSNELSTGNDFDYLDPLDCKIGCQTTLRSKPQIPWYELAIKKDHRRQSCPPMQAHLVSAFEQSLSNMTQRLQQLSATAERKDSELMEMRQTIELLRKQSIQAGLTSAHIQSMSDNNDPTANRLSGTNSTESTPSNGIVSSKTSAQSANTTTATVNGSNASDLLERHLSSDSMCSLNSISSGCSTQDKNNKKKTGWLRTSFKKAFSRNAKLAKNGRYVSVATTLEQIPSSHSINLNSSKELASINASSSLLLLPPQSPTKANPHRMMPVVENAKPIDAIEEENNPVVEDLKKQLREKDLVLTDIRLEALSSASQLESLKETVNKMRQEMLNLKQNNERLQKMVTSRSLAGSEVSLGNNGPLSPNGSIGEPRRYSLADGSLRAPLELPKSLDETEEEDIPPAPAPEPDSLKQSSGLSPTTHSHLNGNNLEHLSTPAEEIPEDQIDGKKISIVVYLGQPESFNKYAEELQQSENDFFDQKIGDLHENGGFEKKPKSFSQCSVSSANEFIIAFTYISGKTTWQNLDYIVRKTFKDYLARIDPGTNLGLNTDSITSYHLGEAKRGPEIGYPELLPCGYIIGNVRSLYICLQDVGSLAFDSLIPRSIVQRYINLLTDHRRLILCGPSGTGKSYLARKLAEFLVSQSQRDNPNEAIATFNVDHKSSEELQHYLGHIAAQASMVNEVSELPSVIILDNLHHASALGDVFQVLLSAGPASKLPCIIGTMSQATCNTTNLQLHHNFRWLLTANHMEPVKGFLARFLRRRLFQLELSTNTAQPHLGAVFAWLPTVWQHINRFLETHSSSDVTIGPRLFLSCPLDLTDAQVWFTDVWNYHLAPYLLEAVREGVQLYGRRGGAWIDPVTFVRETYPWAAINGCKNMPPLRQINAEDVGLEGGAANGTDSQDPLLNMLIRLQEAANYTSNPEQESDCASIDSNVTLDSASEKLEAN